MAEAVPPLREGLAILGPARTDDKSASFGVHLYVRWNCVVYLALAASKVDDRKLAARAIAEGLAVFAMLRLRGQGSLLDKHQFYRDWEIWARAYRA